MKVTGTLIRRSEIEYPANATLVALHDGACVMLNPKALPDGMPALGHSILPSPPRALGGDHRPPCTPASALRHRHDGAARRPRALGLERRHGSPARGVVGRCRTSLPSPNSISEMAGSLSSMPETPFRRTDLMPSRTTESSPSPSAPHHLPVFTPKPTGSAPALPAAGKITDSGSPNPVRRPDPH